MEIRELKEIATGKGYTLSKAFPFSYIIIEKSTGKIAGKYLTLEELETAIVEIGPSAAVVEVDRRPVGWHDEPQPQIEVPPQCVNGYGGQCLCLDKEFYICAVGACERRARCLGVCDQHLQLARLYGDATANCIQKTTNYDETDPEEGCKHGVGFHTYEATKKRWFDGNPINIPLKLMAGSGVTKGSRFLELTARLGILGYVVRPSGVGLNEFAIMDGEGHTLLKGPDPDKLIKEFLMEDD